MEYITNANIYERVDFLLFEELSEKIGMMKQCTADGFGHQVPGIIEEVKELLDTLLEYYDRK
jgi:hypothetical protein